jgi:hypothetical protein
MFDTVADDTAVFLFDLAQANETPRPEAAVEAGGGWSVLVLAYPVLPGEDTPVLTDCDRDCLALLAQAQEPLSVTHCAGVGVGRFLVGGAFAAPLGPDACRLLLG